jgi:hypothetical protein
VTNDRARVAAAVIVAVAGLALLAAACGGSPGLTATPPASGALVYSRCMRAHGLGDFPDPDRTGSFPSLKQLQSSSGSDLNPNNPQFQAAQSACRRLLPNGGTGPTAAEVRQYRSAMLKYARCMRAHGLADFPDPDSRGHLDIGPGSGVDVNSPQFQTAFNACKSKLSP